MGLSVKGWTLLTLIVASAVAFIDKRGSSIVVGYRSVSADVAKQYHDAGDTLITPVLKRPPSSDQLGPGAYISPKRADWPLVPPDVWDCAILAESTAWNLANKAWVPKTADDGCTPLWYNEGSKGVSNRDAYLQSIGGTGFTTSNTLLFSQISGTGAGGLNLKVQCAARSNQKGIDDIDFYGDVDWYSWTNVKGTPQRA
ncbi:hypothetical protein ONZ43_g810 [Nemania bipapillata]|uniref:Uncharacterized protein n=1 Tax=Nemania bipapillata TaxID=110536 RepID=A0ACC2J719_9PEZI|nr:hypothetical protein ONZ43_g810 [Nemania bipapillata]